MRAMPFLFTDKIGDRVVEANHHLLLLLAGTDPKAVAQLAFYRELFRGLKRPARGTNFHDPRWHERSNILAQMIEREQEPLTIDVRQMIGIDCSLLGFAPAGFPIAHGQL